MEKSLKKRSGAPGFTIIELIVYLALTTAAIIVLTSFMVNVTRYAAVLRSKKEVQENGRFIMSRIASDVRAAQSISSLPTPPTTPSHTLTLQSASGATITYSLVGTVVKYDDGTGAVDLTNPKVKVTQLDFINTISGNTNEVTVTLSLTQNFATIQPYTQTITSTLVRRRALYN